MTNQSSSLFSKSGVRAGLAAFAVLAIWSTPVRADEQLFGNVRGAETLPKDHVDLYQFTTLRAGKDVGYYRGWDFETEAEYGFTDKLQGSLSLVNHYFKTEGMEELDDGSMLIFAGFDASLKYRFKSPFIDGYGLAIRPEIGYRGKDDVGGLPENELIVGTTLIYQHNYLDDTLIFAANGGFDFTWGKKPAEQYDHELLLDGLAGLSYRFAPGWFAGVEGRIHSEFPNFDLGKNEHVVVFAGPSLHYASKRWWTTFSWAYQVWGNGVDEPDPHMTYAEEARNEYRWKIGFNF